MKRVCVCVCSRGKRSCRSIHGIRPCFKGHWSSAGFTSGPRYKIHNSAPTVFIPQQLNLYSMLSGSVQKLIRCMKTVRCYYNLSKLFFILWSKLNFFSVTWSGIILICWFAAQETFQIIINVENGCVAEFFYNISHTLFKCFFPFYIHEPPSNQNRKDPILRSISLFIPSLFL